MNPIQDIRTFAGGSGMNLDVDLHLLQPNEYREAWNILVGSPVGGAMGCATNIKGTNSVFDLPINSGFALPQGSFEAVSGCPDITRNAVVFMLMDSINKNHCIVRYYLDTKKVEFVLKSQSALNFVKQFHSFIIDDLLCWSDGYEKIPFVDYNPPFQLNITRATGFSNPHSLLRTYNNGEYAGFGGKTYQWIYPTPGNHAPPSESQYWKLVDRYAYSAITTDTIKRIKPCPDTQPTAVYSADPLTLRNNLRGYLFRFAVRWIYADQGKSVFSSWSEIPLPEGEEYEDGLFINTEPSDITINNIIQVGIDTGGDQIIACELAAIEGNITKDDNGNLPLWEMIYRLDKFDELGNRLVSDNTSIIYNFYNDISGLPLSQEDFYRLMDFVPQVSAFETPIESNRILDCNYTEGFDNVDVDVAFKDTTSPIQLATSQVVNGVYQADIDGSWWSVYPHGAKVTCQGISPFMTHGSILSAVIYRYFVGEDDLYRHPYGDVGDAIRFQCDIVIGQNELPADAVRRLGNMINTKVASNYDYNGVIQKMYYPVPGQPLTLMLVYDTVVNYDPIKHSSDRYYVNKLTVSLLPVINKISSFKQGSIQNFGFEYANDDMQFCTVQKNNTCRAYVPYNQTSEPLIHNLQWSVFHRPPLWAKKWRFVWGGSNIDYYLQLNTPFWTLQADTGDPSGYAMLPSIIDDNFHTKIPFNQTIITTKDQFPTFNISNYQWKKGDRIRLVAIQVGVYVPGLEVLTWDYTNRNADFEIQGVEYLRAASDYLQDTSGTTDPFIVDNSGNKIYDTGQAYLVISILNRADYHLPTSYTPANPQAVWEVYRPSLKVQGNEVSQYNECDDWHDVLNPHTGYQTHEGDNGFANQSQDLVSPATGIFNFGDCYVKLRVSDSASFVCEAMQFSDYFDSEIVNVGRLNVYDPNAQRVNYFSNLLYGGKKIETTNVNELSKVLDSDSVSLRQDFGAIAFAVEVGFQLKIVQRSKQTTFYVGREGLQQASLSNPELISESSTVLSKPIVDDDDFGTIFGQSGLKYDRSYYFYDIYKGAIIRESPNGNVEISALYDQEGKPHGIKDFLTNLSASYRNDGVQNISVVSAYDNTTGLVYFSFKDSITPALNITLGFHEKSDRWVAFYNFNPDMFAFEGDSLTAFTNGKLWLHNDSPVYNNFYGIQYPSMVKIVSNKLALLSKRFLSIFVTSNKKFTAPNAGDVLIPPSGNNPFGMVSLLTDGAFTAVQGKFVADFGKNMVTNSLTPQVSDLINGDDLTGEVAEINLQNNDNTEVKLFAVQVNGVTSQINKNG